MKKYLSIVLASALALSLAACSGTPAPVASAAPEASTAAEPAADAAPAAETKTYEPATVRVAYMPNMGSASALAVGNEQGFFEEVGLTVKTVQFQGGPAEIAAMASGDIDIAQIGHGAHALCAEGQALIFHLDCTSMADAVIANKEKGVNTVADLKGKKVASTAGTSAEIILNLALKEAGLSQSDVEVIEMDANGCVSAMVSGGVDAVATWSPGTMTIRNTLGENAVVLADNATYVDSVTFPSSFITSQKYADANEDILVRFSQALLKADDYRSANIEQTAKYVAKMCEAEEATMLECVTEGNWLTSDFVINGLGDGTVEKYYANQQQVFIDSGRLTAEVPVKDYVLFDIMQKAVDAYTASK